MCIFIFRVCRQVCWFIDTYLLEPIFLSFGFFIIFTHIQNVFNAQGKISITNFGEQLKMDMTQYPWVYIPFAIIFAWWLISRVIHAKRDVDMKHRIETKDRRVAQALENNNTILPRVVEILDEIKQDRVNDGKTTKSE